MRQSTCQVLHYTILRRDEDIDDWKWSLLIRWNKASSFKIDAKPTEIENRTHNSIAVRCQLLSASGFRLSAGHFRLSEDPDLGSGIQIRSHFRKFKSCFVFDLIFKNCEVLSHSAQFYRIHSWYSSLELHSRRLNSSVIGSETCHWRSTNCTRKKVGSASFDEICMAAALIGGIV